MEKGIKEQEAGSRQKKLGRLLAASSGLGRPGTEAGRSGWGLDPGIRGQKGHSSKRKLQGQAREKI